MRKQNYKNLTIIKYKLRNLDTHPFHITYDPLIENDLKRAIDNIFSNYYNFLNFNNYSALVYEVRIGDRENCHFKLSKTFVSNLLAKEFHHEKWFRDAPLILEEGKPDFLGSCFYLINCLQEYAPNVGDALDRFDYSLSYQMKFNCAEEHLVLDYFQEISKCLFGSPIPLKTSQYLLSHDIDFLHSAWKDKLKTQLRNGAFSKILQTTKDLLQGKDDWQNIQEILLVENQLKISSTFFWLCKKGATPFEKVKNADYSIQESYVQDCLQAIHRSSGHQNALHKSISNLSFEEELSHLPPTTINRYHYLKFNIQRDFDILSQSSIMEDHSLGFSKQIGFRNSYGLPFKPFDPIQLRYYNFIEYPLHVMDSSLFYFMACTRPESMLDRLASFIEKHQHSAVISILWHNNFYDKQSYTSLLHLLEKNLTAHTN